MGCGLSGHRGLPPLFERNPAARRNTVITLDPLKKRLHDTLAVPRNKALKIDHLKSPQKFPA